MSIAEAMLGEFQNEVKTTRKFLERVPADKLTWKPHEKSMTAGQLAMHIATVPGAVVSMANKDVMSLANLGGAGPQPASTAEILSALEQSVRTVNQILPTIDDARMMGNWQGILDGKPILSLPRVAVLRSIMLNHWYHHRGQLGVYLRLLGAQVPSSYGPSGDELPDFLAVKK